MLENLKVKLGFEERCTIFRFGPHSRPGYFHILTGKFFEENPESFSSKNGDDLHWVIYL